VFCNSIGTSWHETSWNAAWDTWWHYKEGVIGGPSHWGQTAYMTYADDVWPACHKGRLQSPISISSSNLTYDPSLQPLVIVGKDKQIDLEISNAGQDLRIDLLDASPQILLTGGPLSYEYRVFGALIKFGSKSQHGSDHQVDGVPFPAEVGRIVQCTLNQEAFNYLTIFFETFHTCIQKICTPLCIGCVSYFSMKRESFFRNTFMRRSAVRIYVHYCLHVLQMQLYAYNYLLYANVSMAVPRPHGLAAIAVFLKVGEHPSADLSALLATAEEVQLRGQSRRLNGLLISALLPSTKQYMTYEGSIPFPACHETVTWIVLNQAMIITETQLKALRELRIAPFANSGRMSDNFRPTQSLNNRSVRTNIQFAEQPQFSSEIQDSNSLLNHPNKRTVFHLCFL
ncbi:carbonate dehydratase, eukaryotic-type, partial [Opisthorchis viverrini]